MREFSFPSPLYFYLLYFSVRFFLFLCSFLVYCVGLLVRISFRSVCMLYLFGISFLAYYFSLFTFGPSPYIEHNVVVNVGVFGSFSYFCVQFSF